MKFRPNNNIRLERLEMKINLLSDLFD